MCQGHERLGMNEQIPQNGRDQEERQLLAIWDPETKTALVEKLVKSE